MDRMEKATRLPIREWLELGQAMTDLFRMGPRYFRADHTGMIGVHVPKGLWADGKHYPPSDYVLCRGCDEISRRAA